METLPTHSTRPSLGVDALFWVPFPEVSFGMEEEEGRGASPGLARSTTHFSRSAGVGGGGPFALSGPWTHTLSQVVLKPIHAFVGKSGPVARTQHITLFVFPPFEVDGESLPLSCQDLSHISGTHQDLQGFHPAALCLLWGSPRGASRAGCLTYQPRSTRTVRAPLPHTPPEELSVWLPCFMAFCGGHL